MNDIPRFLCMTSDPYIDAVKPYLWLMRKYWPKGAPIGRVVVAGYTEPEFKLNNLADDSARANPNVAQEAAVLAEFHSIGKFEDYPLNKWSDALIETLDSMDDTFVILMLEDYWVIREINVPAIRLATEYMTRYPNTLKFDLAADRFFAFNSQKDFRRSGWLDIVRSDPESQYHMSLMTGMWRRELLIKVLLPGWNPWEVELAGTPHLRNFKDLDVVGSAQWPIKHTLAFRGGDTSKILLDELDREDVYAMKRLGFLSKWM